MAFDPLSIIPGFLGLLGNMIGATSSTPNTKLIKWQTALNVKAAKNLADYQYDLQKQQFDYTNEYNLPENIVQRLKDAGLNPNLAYSTGSVVGSTANMPSVSQPHANQADPAALVQYQIQSRQLAIQSALAAANIAKSAAETKKIKLENQRTEAEQPYFADNARLKNESLRLANELTETNVNINSYLSTVNRIKADLTRFMLGEITPTDMSTKSPQFKFLSSLKDTPFGQSLQYDLTAGYYTHKQIQSGLNIMAEELKSWAPKLRKLNSEAAIEEIKQKLWNNGINPNDPLWARALVVFLAELTGVDLGNVMSEGVSTAKDVATAPD